MTFTVTNETSFAIMSHFAAIAALTGVKFTAYVKGDAVNDLGVEVRLPTWTRVMYPNYNKKFTLMLNEISVFVTMVEEFELKVTLA